MCCYEVLLPCNPGIFVLIWPFDDDTMLVVALRQWDAVETSFKDVWNSHLNSCFAMHVWPNGGAQLPKPFIRHTIAATY